MKLSVFIVCHNNGWMVRDTVEALRDRFDNIRLEVVDECSTAQRTLDTLRELEMNQGVRVHRHRSNVGPKRVRRSPRYWFARRKPFVLTDPDLDLKNLPADTFDVLRDVADDLGLRCVGLALDISDTEDLISGDYFHNCTIVEWESRFWRTPVNLSHIRTNLEGYRAPIDTTFAYYDFSRPKGMQIRVAGAYTVRHLPWHKSYIRDLDEGDYRDYFHRGFKFATTAPLVQQYYEACQRNADMRKYPHHGLNPRISASHISLDDQAGAFRNKSANR